MACIPKNTHSPTIPICFHTSTRLESLSLIHIYKELFPDRMMKDYIRLEKVESPLLELIPELNKTAGLHQMGYSISLRQAET